MSASEKPPAVKEVEASAPTAVDEAWKKLASGEPVSGDDLPLLVEAAREDRKRWLIKQAKKGKE